MDSTVQYNTVQDQYKKVFNNPGLKILYIVMMIMKMMVRGIS